MNGDPFVMIFGGSSVTAGWDNYYYQTYSEVFRRQMEPIFANLSSPLIIRNIAQGANPCRPYTYCYQTMGGEEADWIGWEQSFDCGRDSSTPELVSRIAARMKAVLYISASGSFTPTDCVASTVAATSFRCLC